MESIKCHIFKWTTTCYHCSPYHYYEFEAGFREIVCPYLIKYIGVEAMNDGPFVETDNYDEGRIADFWLMIPIEHYNEEDFNAIDAEVEALADEHFGGWEFGQEDDDIITITGETK